MNRPGIILFSLAMNSRLHREVSVLRHVIEMWRRCHLIFHFSSAKFFHALCAVEVISPLISGDARPFRHHEFCYAHLLICRNFSTLQVGSLDSSRYGWGGKPPCALLQALISFILFSPRRFFSMEMSESSPLADQHVGALVAHVAISPSA